MNGHVFVRSKPGNTRFHVYLPIQGMQEISSMMPAEEKKVSSDTPRLLIVDDEYNIRSMLQEVFEMKGYKVYTAANGKEAVDIYDQHQAKIDLVILDMVMPVMDGKTTFKELKKRNKDQKILVISGYSEREDLQEILQNGVLGFLSKPFQLNEIINKVESIIKEKE
ncbi:MAG: response regulator [Calditrichaeota bacterium]|nr:MAG: response regulator [Calditrichota bacterium]